MQPSIGKIIFIFFLSVILRSVHCEAEIWTVSKSKRGKRVTSDLQHAIDHAQSGDVIRIEPGIYEAKPRIFIDSLCGNCLEHRTFVSATQGFHIENKSLTIHGVDRERCVLKTNAGYGVYVNRSVNFSISNLTITGGVRDTSGDATDAAIVVKYSRATISDVRIIDDTIRMPNVIVGIGGIFGREGSELIISNNFIYNNTWDGIALYRGATAFITDNIIDKGRGVGIGITWDANAIVSRNRISHYWKGIGTFGTSRAIVRNNAVFDNLGWGLVVTGSSFMEASNNAIVRNGNCGIAPWDSSAHGVFTNNIIAENGWRKEWVCPCVGYWMNGDERNFEFSYNDLWQNKEGNYKNVSDQTNINGNISVDPMFRDSTSFIPTNTVLTRHGNPSITNSDGTRSGIGIQARVKTSQ